MHLMKIADGFGIKDEVIRKGVHATGGNDAAAKVAEGKADIAVVLISEIHAKERQARRPAARADPALDGLFRRDPGEQHRSGRRARLRRGADRARDAGALDQGRLAAGEVASS